MEPGYSPYTARKQQGRKWFKMPAFSFSGKSKKILWILLGTLFGLFLIVYIALGELRFFANHYLGLTFFRKNYLVLLQNNYELRPGGGFITAYGNLDTFMGFVTNLSFHNAYEIDTDRYEKPPYPHEEMLKNEWYQGYTFRDANWEADFRMAAPELIRFYQQKFPDKDVDGIIVMNFSVIEAMLDQWKEVDFGDKTLTKNTLFSAIEFAVNNVDRHSEEALKGRKDILGDLAAVLIGKAKWNPLDMKAILISALKEKDLYLWFADEGLQKAAEKRGWANHLEIPEASDFLAVNVANLGAKKADRYLIKEVHHYVNLTKEIPEMTTEVTLRFPGFNNIYSDNYKGYLRVYLPEGAVLQESPVDSITEKQPDLTVVGTPVVLPTGSKTTLSYRYTLSRSFLSDNQYRLKLIKQSGGEMDYKVTVETARDTMTVSDIFETRENRARWQGFLTSDLTLALSILPDTTPPYPVEQVFENLNTIKIYWSEPIAVGSGGDALNYTVTDLDKINEKTDTDIKVTYAEVINASESRLELTGITEQTLERYQITLKNIQDLAGNSMEPDPKIITAVQRFKQGVAEVTVTETPASEVSAP